MIRRRHVSVSFLPLPHFHVPTHQESTQRNRRRSGVLVRNSVTTSTAVCKVPARLRRARQTRQTNGGLHVTGLWKNTSSPEKASKAQEKPESLLQDSQLLNNQLHSGKDGFFWQLPLPEETVCVCVCVCARVCVCVCEQG